MGKDNALIIFDWDDTLFPTYWLLNNGINIDNAQDIRNHIIYFKELDMTLTTLLKVALSIGKVIIITNANIEWLYLSKKVLPETSKLIDKRIQLISARDIYHHAYTIADWKKNTFKNNIYGYVNWADQIISFGDAMYEYEALIALRKYISPKKHLKTIKLVQSPSFDNLIDQLNVLSKSMNDIYKQPHHLDLKYVVMS